MSFPPVERSLVLMCCYSHGFRHYHSGDLVLQVLDGVPDMHNTRQIYLLPHPTGTIWLPTSTSSATSQDSNENIDNDQE